VARAATSAIRPVAPRAWQRMLSGRRLDLLDPTPLDVEIEDIAHGLARVARWNGQTTGANIFSVAQHTLLVDEVARRRHGEPDRRLALALMLHDAPEYVIGDMITPFKAVIGDTYKVVEKRLLAAIHRRFGLRAPPGAAGDGRARLPDAVDGDHRRGAFLGAFREDRLTKRSHFLRRTGGHFAGKCSGVKIPPPLRI
jgi:hypothetical protein